MKTDKDQKRMLWIWTAVILGVAVFYIGFTSHYLWQNKEKTDIEWEERVHAFETLSDEEQGSTKDAVRVGVTTYLENVTDIDIRQSTFDADMQIIFTWKKGSRLNGEELGSMLGHFSVYNGKITDIETQESSVSEDGICIQKIKVSAQISNKLETVRFPLNSYQLRIYIVPRESIEKMIWVPDGENSSSNPNLSLAGFRLERLATNSYYRRTEENVSYDGELIDDQERVYSEVLTAMEFNRSTLGLYLKCTIALYATGIWALLMLLTCARHRTDSLSMLGPVFFGVVSNILVGANLVPDAMETGLLEFINIWGIYTILIIAVIIMQVNHIRKNKAQEEFASRFGWHMFGMIAATTILGHIILPLSAYRFF